MICCVNCGYDTFNKHFKYSGCGDIDCCGERELIGMVLICNNCGTKTSLEIN